VPSVVIDELMLLRDKASPSFKRDVDFVLSLVKRCETISIISEVNEAIDDIIFRLAEKTGYPVATNDSDLRNRLKKKGIPVIYMRQRSHLEINGLI
jgi:rRNA-processing protein FCF1